MSNPNPADYGLDDSDILTEATELFPDLFTALSLIRNAATDYPLRTKDELRRVLMQSATDENTSVAATRSIESLPGDFLPVESKRDLLRKVYIAMAIADRSAAEEVLERLRSGEIVASHPMPEVI